MAVLGFRDAGCFVYKDEKEMASQICRISKRLLKFLKEKLQSATPPKKPLRKTPPSWDILPEFEATLQDLYFSVVSSKHKEKAKILTLLENLLQENSRRVDLKILHKDEKVETPVFQQKVRACFCPRGFVYSDSAVVPSKTLLSKDFLKTLKKSVENNFPFQFNLESSVKVSVFTIHNFVSGFGNNQLTSFVEDFLDKQTILKNELLELKVQEAETSSLAGVAA